MLLTVSYAQVPDADRDGVPDTDDKCPNSLTTAVDQFGCGCEQICQDDNNPCTDTCGKNNVGGLACNMPNNKPCPGGYCSGGQCIQQQTTSQRGTTTQNGQARASTSAACTDSDGGSIFVRGTTTGLASCIGTNCPIISSTDFCVDSSTLFEYNCDSDGVIKGATYPCSCKDGVCSQQTTTTQTSSSQTSSISVNDNLGPQSTLVIVASIGSQQPPADAATVQDLVFGEHEGTVNDYYKKNSFSKANLVGRVMELPLPQTVCTDEEILNGAIKVTQENNVYLPEYTRIILIIPTTDCVTEVLPGVKSGGRGTFGKRTINTNYGPIQASVSWINKIPTLRRVGHELGHNFGLAHANRMACLNCESIAYGDPFDIMGMHKNPLPPNPPEDIIPKHGRHLNAPHKEEAGWLSNNNIITTTGGEYMLKPLEIPQPSGSIQQIKLPLNVKPPFYLNANNVYYTLEFRQPIDYDAGEPNNVYSGVSIHLSAVSSPPQIFITNLISYNPSDISPLLQVGQTFRDNINDYEITLKNIDANVVLVKIARATTPTTTTTTLVPSFSITPTRIRQSDKFNVEISSIEPNAQIKLYLEDRVTGKMLIPGANFDNHNTGKETFPNIDARGLTPGKYRIWVEIVVATTSSTGAIKSNVVDFDVGPRLEIISLQSQSSIIQKGDGIAVRILDVSPNEQISLTLLDSNENILVSNAPFNLPVLDDFTRYAEAPQGATNDWTLGTYFAYVSVVENGAVIANSPKVKFDVVA